MATNCDIVLFAGQYRRKKLKTSFVGVSCEVVLFRGQLRQVFL